MRWQSYLSTLISTLLIAQANGKLCLVYKDKEVEIVTDKKRIGGANVKKAINEATNQMGDFSSLDLLQLTLEEFSRIHRSLYDHLNDKTRVELLRYVLNQANTTDGEAFVTEKFLKAGMTLIKSIAGVHPDLLGKELIATVNKNIKDVSLIHPLTVLLNQNLNLTSEFLRKVFVLPYCEQQSSEAMKRDAIIDVILQVDSVEDLYNALQMDEAPEQLVQNARIKIFLNEYKRAFEQSEEQQSDDEGNEEDEESDKGDDNDGDKDNGNQVNENINDSLPASYDDDDSFEIPDQVILEELIVENKAKKDNNIKSRGRNIAIRKPSTTTNVSRKPVRKTPLHLQEEVRFEGRRPHNSNTNNSRITFSRGKSSGNKREDDWTISDNKSRHYANSKKGASSKSMQASKSQATIPKLKAKSDENGSTSSEDYDQIAEAIQRDIKKSKIAHKSSTRTISKLRELLKAGNKKSQVLAERLKKAKQQREQIKKNLKNMGDTVEDLDDNDGDYHDDQSSVSEGNDEDESESEDTEEQDDPESSGEDSNVDDDDSNEEVSDEDDDYVDDNDDDQKWEFRSSKKSKKNSKGRSSSNEWRSKTEGKKKRRTSRKNKGYSF